MAQTPEGGRRTWRCVLGGPSGEPSWARVAMGVSVMEGRFPCGWSSPLARSGGEFWRCSVGDGEVRPRCVATAGDLATAS